MAYKVINASSNAVSLGDGKNGTVKTVEGHLVGVELGRGTRKNSSIYTLQTFKGGMVKVWGSTATDTALLVGDGKTRKLNPGLVNVAVRLTHLETRSFGTGKKKQTFKDIEIAVDPANHLKGAGKEYQIKS